MASTIAKKKKPTYHAEITEREQKRFEKALKKNTPLNRSQLLRKLVDNALTAEGY